MWLCMYLLKNSHNTISSNLFEHNVNLHKTNESLLKRVQIDFKYKNNHIYMKKRFCDAGFNWLFKKYAHFVLDTLKMISMINLYKYQGNLWGYNNNNNI